MFKIYLAGPITGLSYAEARLGWREYFPTLITDERIKCYSPMRGKDVLKDATTLHRASAAYETSPITSANGITNRDRNDVFTADLMVANFLGAEKGSLGTAVEFGWANAWGVPIITVIEKEGNPHDHMMLNYMTMYRVDNIEDAAKLSQMLLLEGV